VDIILVLTPKYSAGFIGVVDIISDRLREKG
jgi:hypothetical protein